MNRPEGVWVGSKRCGCCVAVCRESGEERYAEHNNAQLIEWLLSGITVKLVSRDEWHSDHYPGFLECPHAGPDTTRQEQERT